MLKAMQSNLYANAGNLEIDKDVCAQLMATGAFQSMSLDVDEVSAPAAATSSASLDDGSRQLSSSLPKSSKAL